MRHIGRVKSMVVGMLVTIWAIACYSPAIDEPTPIPAAGRTAREDACEFAERMINGDDLAVSEFAEWIDLAPLLHEEVSGGLHQDWQRIVHLWRYAHEYAARPAKGKGAAHLEISRRWNYIERGATEYLQALCISKQPLKSRGENIRGCDYYYAYVEQYNEDKDVTDALAEMNLALYWEDEYHPALYLTTAIFLNATSIMAFLEPTITPVDSVASEYRTASFIGDMSLYTMSSLCTDLFEDGWRPRREHQGIQNPD